MSLKNRNMKHLLLTFMLFASVAVIAQKGNPFPPMEGETLTHSTVLIPDDLKGKHTLIGLAFSKDSEKYLKSWFNPVYNQLLAKPDPNSLMSFSYDVNVYFIPMLTGAKRPAYQQVMKKVEDEVDKKLHPHILFYKGTLKEYEDALGIDDKDVPYIFLLDETGKIIYSTSGNYSESKLQKVIDELPFED